MLNPGPHGEPHCKPRWVQPSQPRQHDRSSLCWERFWACRPYWHHLPACLPGAVLEQLHNINLVLSSHNILVSRRTLSWARAAMWKAGARMSLARRESIRWSPQKFALQWSQMISHIRHCIKHAFTSLPGGAERGFPSHGERCPVPWLAESHKARQKVSCHQLKPIAWHYYCHHMVAPSLRSLVVWNILGSALISPLSVPEERKVVQFACYLFLREGILYSLWTSEW